MSKVSKKTEDWMNSKWRPAMGWMYMVVCIFDFILFPIMWAGIQFWETQAANDAFRQWNPLTLQGAGLFHMAMGAVLGITAWSRGQEKIAGVANGTPMNNMPVSFNNVNSAPAYSTATAYESTYTSVTPIQSGVTKGYGGKKAPPPAYEPEI